MKTTIEDYLQRIDASFKDKSKKDIYMTYVMIFSAIFAFSYLLYWDGAEAEFKTKRAQVVAVESKIASDQMYLQQNPPSVITRIENEIKEGQNQIVIYKDNNEYIKNKIEEISALVYDEQSWGEYLHSISKYAIQHDIKLLEFTNKFAKKENSSFGHVLNITINSTGDFKNTLKFINSLEQSDLVVDLHGLDIQAKQELESNLIISVWGITY
jgi:Tfp pilus assembly protein PilO